MNFKHLKLALNQALDKSLGDISAKETKPRLKRNEASKRKIERQRIVKGIARDPVNKQAAMVTARASWIFHPPQTQKNMSQESAGSVCNSENERIAIRPNGDMVTESGRKLGTVASLQLSQIRTDLAEYNKTRDLFVSGCNEFEESINRQRKSIMLATQELSQVASSALMEIRSMRMPVVSEVSQMLPALKDVRAFFIGADYGAQMSRLKEFVDLCERLERLKKSGTLDAISDTIIKLSLT